MSYRSAVDTFVPSPASQTTAGRLWIPHQHGAWAMLAVPLLLGISATRPNVWHAALAAAAITGYLASATAQTWVRARVRQRYTASLIVYVFVATLLGVALIATHPVLLLALTVLAPAGAVTLIAAKLGRARGVIAGFAQVTAALVLVPAAAVLAGSFDPAAVGKAAFLASVYLVGTLLAVRSVIREQRNAGFAAVSVGFHLAATAVAVVLLSPPFVVLLGLLAIRAALLPIVQRRRCDTARPLRPVHVGLVEMACATCVVALAFLFPI
jgi:YwiC-like protein